MPEIEADARPRALVIVAHPEPASFGWVVAKETIRGIKDAGSEADIADLASEGFDPRISAADLAHYLGTAGLPNDVRREQARIDAADALILVFPVFWWSMPALLKGWIDRVFTSGWAYRVAADGTVEGGLRDCPERLLATGAGDGPGYDKHGYRAAIATQIEHGTLAFSGLHDVETHLLYDVESADASVRAAHLRTAYNVGRRPFGIASRARDTAATLPPGE